MQTLSNPLSIASKSLYHIWMIIQLFQKIHNALFKIRLAFNLKEKKEVKQVTLYFLSFEAKGIAQDIFRAFSKANLFISLYKFFLLGCWCKYVVLH